MRRWKGLVLLPLVAVAFTATPSQAAGYTDLDGHWAASAARYVAETNDWMRVSGTTFRPGARLSRGQLAIALMRAFGDEVVLPDPPPTFTDLTTGSISLVRGAAVATARGWLRPFGTEFRPSLGVTKAQLERALVLALRDARPDVGLTAVINGINGIHTSDGYRFKHSSWLAYQVIAKQLGFNFNYPGSSGLDPVPGTLITRGDGAHALAAAARAADGWRLWGLRRYVDITLPPLTPARRKVVEFGLRYMGHPYVYATSTARGFDCSGWVWWVLRAGSGPSSRGYAGWSIPQRSSYDMARNTRTKIAFDRLRPLDLLFWDYEGEFKREWQGVGHAGFYLGNGWMMHTSGGRGGATIDWMGDGHYAERLVWGRRVVPSTV